MRFDVQFTSPQGVPFQIPGFYDGYGQGGLDGDVWKARFSADTTGKWKFKKRQSYAWVFNSLHPGGAQFVFNDGNTRFIADSLDYELFARLNYIHDGDPLSEF